jgi:ribosomal protein L40E
LFCLGGSYRNPATTTMICSRCGLDNPASMKFCGNCAASLVSICGKCRAENPPQFKFCGQCAAPLGGAALGGFDTDSRSAGLPADSDTPA